MRRISILLAVCLLLAAVPATAAEPFRYERADLGFTLTVPGLSEKDVVLEETETGVDFYHAPSRAAGYGLIGSIEVVSPRSAFFSAGYDRLPYRILAMGADRVYLWKSYGGGVDTVKALLDAYVRTVDALSVERLRECLVPARPDDLPVLDTAPHKAYLPAAAEARPDAPLTRGELAELLYALLDADNKDAVRESPFSDTAGRPCARAAGYLADYGILSGYPDGTFRPDAPVSRAQFAVLLHRCQFAPPVGWYGDAAGFSDVPAGHWAKDYVDSAAVLGWMSGYADGGFRPDGQITRAQAVTALNRMLGRDASQAAVGDARNPFPDLDETHGAYANLLEAAGALSDPPQNGTPPAGAEASWFRSDGEGWAVSGGRLRRTGDGGRTWETVGAPLPCAVSGLFFFDSRNGVLLGHSGDDPLLLLRTADGGETWTDALADPATRAAVLAAESFPTANGLLPNLVSAEFRPLGGDAVTLVARYRPYEVVYALDLTAVRQTALTAEGVWMR